MNTKKLIQLSILGGFFWFVAALFIHFVPALFRGGVETLLLFLGVIPTAWAFNRMVVRLFALQSTDILFGLTTVCVIGLLLDGIFLTWVHSLYGTQPEVLLVGAAWLLFGVGVILALALARTRREQKAA